MVHLSPSVATPKSAKAKTPKKSSIVNTTKPEMKTPKQAKNTPAKAAPQTPKMKKEALVKEEKSTLKVSALQTPKTGIIKKEVKNTPKAASQTPKNVTASAMKNKKATTSKHEKPVHNSETESEDEEKDASPQPSPKKDVNNSKNAEMSSEEENNEMESKLKKSAGQNSESKKAAGKRKIEDSNQSGGDQKRQKITHDNELFIARLKFTTSMDTVKEHFSQFGEVVNVGLPLKPNKQSNKGFAFVAFKEASSMKKAMADTNQEIDSAKIIVEAKKAQEAVSKASFPKPSHPNELFVGGLDNSTQKHTIEEYFSKFGKVGNVTLPWNLKQQRNKGYGFVSFESAAGLQSALEEEDHEIDGKKVGVHAAGKKSEENGVVSKKAETKKVVKAALAAVAVEKEVDEEDEDEEMEGEVAEDEDSESDDEAEGEDEEEVEGVHDEEKNDDGAEDDSDEMEGEEAEDVDGESDDEAEDEEVEEEDDDDVGAEEEECDEDDDTDDE